MALVFIGLGSNLGDGRVNLRTAWQQLGASPGITTLALSSPYLTRPVVKKEWEREERQIGEQWFTNAAGVLETRLSPLELLGLMQEVETNMGRDRQKTVNRAVDLDILYYDDLHYVDGRLEVPHPELRGRLFVLAPLEELAPDRKHPITGLTTSQMRRALPDSDSSDIRRLAWQDETGCQGGREL